MRKFFWNLLGSFGVMFAILSWLQESFLLVFPLPFLKGLIAFVSGIILYFILTPLTVEPMPLLTPYRDAVEQIYSHSTKSQRNSY